MRRIADNRNAAAQGFDADGGVEGDNLANVVPVNRLRFALIADDVISPQGILCNRVHKPFRWAYAEKLRNVDCRRADERDAVQIRVPRIER